MVTYKTLMTVSATTGLPLDKTLEMLKGLTPNDLQLVMEMIERRDEAKYVYEEAECELEAILEIMI